MRHLLLAATMLSVALVITFGAASALESVASNKSHGVQDDQLQVARIAPPAKAISSKERITTLFR